MSTVTKTSKKTYVPPSLAAWGTVADLTAVGMTNPGDDAKGGSVIPAACDKNPNLPPCPA